jgi:diacylglycerol kinase (ATP)
MMKKLFAKVIVNPTAGANSTRRKWPDIRSLLKAAGIKFDFQFTEAKGHGIELARTAALDGYRFLVAVGGDGTIHEVANGIMDSHQAAETALGIVSTGTGSDLTRSTGLSSDYARACSSLNSQRRLVIDVGRVEYQVKGQTRQRYFLNSAGIGFDAEVVAATERLPKYFGGTIPYLTGLFRSFIGYHNKRVSFSLGNLTEQARVLSIVVANGRYFGGGMHIAPEAKLDDNLFDVVIIGNFGKIELLKNLSRVYKGTHLTHPKVRLEKCNAIDIRSDERFLLHADGELLGEGPASFHLLPAALSLVV